MKIFTANFVCDEAFGFLFFVSPHYVISVVVSDVSPVASSEFSSAVVAHTHSIHFNFSFMSAVLPVAIE